MAEYYINNSINKVLDVFGLQKIKYQYIKGVQEDLEYMGIRPLVSASAQFALLNIYKPYMSKHELEYEASLTNKESDIASGFNNFMPQIAGKNNYVFSSLKFKDCNDFLTKKDITMTDNFIPACLFQSSMSKNIVKTSVLNRPGTIKEYTSDGDWVINCKCVITGNNGIYPFDKVKNLVSFLNQPQSIEIISPYLNQILGVTYVVVDSWDMPQVEGGISQQGFNINLTSDIPFLIEEIGYVDQMNQVIGESKPSF